MIELADPFTPYPIWQSPDYQPDPNPAPLYAREDEALLAHCRTALSRRQASYPAMIERGSIAPDLAARDIAAWEALAAEWLWIISGQGEPPQRQTLPDRVAALDLAKVRVDQEMAKGNRSHDIRRQSHVIAALRWHLARSGADGDPMIHSCARFNHAHRAEIGARFCGTCEKWNFNPETHACSDPACGLPRHSPEKTEMAA